MIMLMHMGTSTQMMRIAHRVGLFDPDKLDMKAPVYRSSAKMIQAYRDAEHEPNMIPKRRKKK